MNYYVRSKNWNLRFNQITHWKTNVNINKKSNVIPRRWKKTFKQVLSMGAYVDWIFTQNVAKLSIKLPWSKSNTFLIVNWPFFQLKCLYSTEIKRTCGHQFFRTFKSRLLTKLETIMINPIILVKANKRNRFNTIHDCWFS